MMRRAPQFLPVILCVGMMMTSGELGAQEEARPVKGYPNLPTPTLGGRQFWTDYQWNDGWRIQQNAITGHWRLLSPNRIRHAWGSRAACDAARRTRIRRQVRRCRRRDRARGRTRPHRRPPGGRRMNLGDGATRAVQAPSWAAAELVAAAGFATMTVPAAR